MSTAFITQDIWSHLTKAVRSSRQSCAVAVAYFGSGAGRLLPLPKGSRLVVDASERAVASGQTCPADLSKLVRGGVKAYSVPNLHAKVFVLGRAAYIGSPNVSTRSASQLIEAVVRTTEPGAVSAARKFVRDHCLHELTPAVLQRLGKLYRPPQVPGGKQGKTSLTNTSPHPTLPRVLLAQLHLGDWSEHEYSLHDAGLATARKRREHPRSFQFEAFMVTGKCGYQRGDVVVQVTDHGGGKILVSPPGNVLHTRSGRDGKANKTCVYLERATDRRRRLKVLAPLLGRGGMKRLRRDGVVRNAAFARALLNIWAD